VHPLVYSGNFNFNKDDLYIAPEDYGMALIKLFDRWFFDKDYKINIEPLYQYLGNLITGEPRECSTLFSCQERFISIDPFGDVYPCGRFAGIKEFYYGNINQEPLEKILSSPVRRKLLERNSNSLKDCQVCKYKKICNGGCMNNAYNAGNIFAKDNYCEAYKMVFDHLSLVLQKFPQLKELKLEKNLESMLI
ncbi:MAG: SPASM domain-containing protein, partial [Candidatus Pacearchaeota archaeon]